eukprot:Phypoly_transcript_01633.p1 GENE.Phypoly_transcript_01633~~Phypoly_transcript_01633.p1  ORF type:complete len:1064 (+),score=132.57 Phypoly_transcript_01633:31-3192(+)
MTRIMPKQFLDSEIWFGRGQYSYVFFLVNESYDAVNWEFLRMISFDDPSRVSRKSPFEDRYAHILDIPTTHPFNIVATRVLCQTQNHLAVAVQAVIDHSGEGIILRKRNSVYKHGRTHLLIKLKAAHGDREAIVARKTEDFVELRLPNGVIFEVPLADVHVPAAVGDVVTFSYESWARRELPVGPKIYRIRTDLSWDEVVQTSMVEKQHLNEKSQVPDFSSHALGHWTAKRARLFLESYAKNRNLDPLIPDTWYNMSSSELRAVKGADSIFSKGGGYFKTLKTLFPDIGLDTTKFLQNPWREITHRRMFFEKFAQENSFDALVPSNWYSQSILEGVLASTGSKGVLLYHDRSVTKALLDLFPNIGLDKDKIPVPNEFRKTKARIQFFLDYARAHKFDPLIANNWYTQPREEIYSFKGAQEVAAFHKRSVTQALIDLFPKIGLVKSRFPYIHPWRHAGYRKKFFETYARERGFDPLNPENWYKQSLRKITALRRAQRILRYHKDSVTQALIDLFPNIGLVKANFSRNWRSVKRLKIFFEDYAKSKNFNPRKAHNWYLQPLSSVASAPGAKAVMEHCNNNIGKALIRVFPDIGLKEHTFSLIAPWNEPKERRKFFETYAAQHSFDPLIPGNWYNQPEASIWETKGAKEVMFYHNGEVVQALIDLFPEIGLQKSVFLADQKWEEAENRINFFKLFAVEYNFDPNVPENWYRTAILVMSQKGANSVMSQHEGSVSQALIDLFPSIGFEQVKFLEHGGFQEKFARRQFFESFAEKNGFDPLVADNWYFLRPSRFAAAKGANFVLDHYGHSLPEALVDLFPEVSFDLNSFAAQYRNPESRKNLFIQYAKRNSFDALIASNWYPQIHGVLQTPGSSVVLSYYNGSVVRALAALFPNLSFDKSKFHYPNQIWQQEGNRRKLFEQYALANNFDPLKPNNWYSQSRTNIIAFKGVRAALEYHQKSVAQALVDLFPEIGLDLLEFDSVKLWKDSENRRKVFEKFAAENKFDPLDPEKWYNHRNSNIINYKGVSGVLRYHDYSVRRALMELFPEIGLQKSKFRLK